MEGGERKWVVEGVGDELYRDLNLVYVNHSGQTLGNSSIMSRGADPRILAQ